MSLLSNIAIVIFKADTPGIPLRSGRIIIPLYLLKGRRIRVPQWSDTIVSPTVIQSNGGPAA
jgi:hypothetical protein